MKLFTTKEQTEVLISLGFKGPQGELQGSPSYFIGELYSLLESFASFEVRYVYTKKAYFAKGSQLGKAGLAYSGCYHSQQIDALYDLLVGLKKRNSLNTNFI